MSCETDKDDVLELMFRLGCSDARRNVMLHEVKMHLGSWAEDRFWNTAQTLVDEQLIELRSRMSYAALTLAGRRRAENRTSPPVNHTHNTLHIGSAVNSPIQQAGAGSSLSQSVAYSSSAVAELTRLVGVLEVRLGELGLDQASTRRAQAQVATIKAQLADDPDPVIVQQAGRTLRNVIEGATGSLIASAAQPTIWSWVGTALTMFG
jgi:hypothetical protein